MSLFYYLLKIKLQIFIVFYSQFNSQIKWQNNIIKVYLQIFQNFEQIKLLLMVNFVYNNVKNVNTGHIFLKLNYSYYF